MSEEPKITVEMEGQTWTRGEIESLHATISSPGWALVERVLTAWKAQCDETLLKASVSGEELLRVSGLYRGLALPFNLPAIVDGALEEIQKLEDQERIRLKLESMERVSER